MHYLLLDTSSWINIIERELRTCLQVIETLVNDGSLTLLITDEIKKEMSPTPKKKIREFRIANRTMINYYAEIRQEICEDHRAFLDMLARDAERGVNVLWSDRAIPRLQVLMDGARMIPGSGDVSSRVVERFRLGKAPFHVKSDSMSDALIFEKFAEAVECSDVEDTYAFVTDNHRDFVSNSRRSESDSVDGAPQAVQVSRPLPHPDIAHVFDGRRVFFHLDLLAVLEMLFPREMEDASRTQSMPLGRRTEVEIRAYLERVTAEQRHERFLRRRAAVEAKRLRLGSPEPPVRRMTLGWLRQEDWDRESAYASLFETHYDGQVPVRSEYNAGVIAGQVAMLRWVLGLTHSPWSAYRDVDDDDTADLLPLAKGA